MHILSFMISTIPIPSGFCYELGDLSTGHSSYSPPAVKLFKSPYPLLVLNHPAPHTDLALMSRQPARNLAP
jgi:dipeptidyl aminopeptidase/acylaminoacyl peptidase